MKNILKNPIFLILMVAVGTVILAEAYKSAPNGDQSSSAAQAVLGGDNVFYDFGAISMANGKVSYDFKVRNTTENTVEIERIYTSCMCTEALLIKGDTERGPFGMPGHGFVPPVNESLQSGEEAIVRVIFDPAAHGPAGVGTIKRAVYLEGGRSKLIELQFSATVTP